MQTMRPTDLLRGLLLPSLILAAWTGVTLGGYIPSYVLPSPVAVARTFVDFVFGGTPKAYSGTFWKHLLASTERVALGFSLGSVTGIILGIILGYSQRAAAYVEPTIQLTRAIPGICWLPLALIWLGVGTPTSVFLISLGSFYSVFISTLQGVKYMDPTLLRAGRSLGASERDVLFTIILPATFPSILSGLRIGLAYSWVYMVLGEFTGVNDGLGATLLQSRETMDTDLIIVIMILIGAIGVIVDRAMLLLMRKTIRLEVL